MVQAAALLPALPGLSGRRLVRWAIVFAIAAALAIAAGALLDRRAERAPLDPAGLVAWYGPVTYNAALQRAEFDLASARKRQALGRGEWLRDEAVARGLIARHRLSGDYADLAEADRLIAGGMAGAVDPGGPVLSRASLSLLLHRLPEADAALSRFSRWVAPLRVDRADARALAGDIAQQRGDLDSARRAYAEAQSLAPTPGIALRQAMLLARSGELAEGQRWLEGLLATPRQSPRTLAEQALLRAQLAYAEGDWDGAGSWIAAADRLFPGYWLTRTYAAQQLALDGRPTEAARRYAAIAEATNNPEVMDALAQLLRLQGNRNESLAWWNRADAIWRERLIHFPEAAGLHAAEHALVGGRPAEALRLARTEVARRPHGATLAILARALLLAGRPDDALRALERAEAQGWVSAGLLLLRSEAAAAKGDEEVSGAALRRATAINPRAAEPGTRLIWFGHD